MRENYDIDKIKTILSGALTKLVNNDLELIRRKVQEESINHKLAIYLEEELRETGWPHHVDVEYNKNGDKPKTYTDARGKKKRAKPDIIVHQRKEQDENLLFFEIKKLNSSKLDFEKVKAFLKQKYKYRFACLINYKPKENYIYVILKYIKDDAIEDHEYKFSKTRKTLTETP